MRFNADYWGYELGHFLPPEVDDIGRFFILLQKPMHYYEENDDTFLVKLGKSRFLDKNFKIDCLKVLVYSSSSGEFNLHNIELKSKKDGTKYFDAVSFLDSLGIKYKINDTSNYRHFKSRLSKTEITFNEELKKVGFIHRRINADDYESIDHYAYVVKEGVKKLKPLSVAEKGFYFFTFANDHYMSYHELVYYPTEEDMCAYIRSEFQRTDGAEIASYPMKVLMDGCEYQTSHRMGTATTEVHCQMFHETLTMLYRELDNAELYDDEEKRIKLSTYLRSAKNEVDIQNVIDAYNDSWENWW